MPYHLSKDKKTVLQADGKPVPGGRHKSPAEALAHLQALEANVSDSKNMKVGARNNASDKGTIQAIHDNACDLGADCKPMDMNEGITAMLMNKKIDFKAIKSMGALEYARQEMWDIQTVCSA